MIDQHIWLALLWALFGATHSLLAASWLKSRIHALLGRGFRLYRLAYSTFFMLFLIAIVIYMIAIPTNWFWIPGVPLALLSAILTLTGIAAMVVCIREYFFYLSGFEVFFKRKDKPKTLERGGLHRYVRHPLYAATLFALWSLFLATPTASYLVTCLMVTLYTVLGIAPEEQKLKREYGWEYEIYQRKTPMLIPFLKPPKIREPKESSDI